MARGIIPRNIRGRLFYQTADVLFPTFAQAATAWSASVSHRLDIADEIDRLTIDQLASLSEMRRAGKDEAGFSAACKREADFAVRIRQLRAEVASHG